MAAHLRGIVAREQAGSFFIGNVQKAPVLRIRRQRSLRGDVLPVLPVGCRHSFVACMRRAIVVVEDNVLFANLNR